MASTSSTQPHLSTQADVPGTSDRAINQENNQLVITMAKKFILREEHYEKGGFLRVNPGYFLNDYEMVKYLGRGGFGTVWLAKHVGAGTFAAMKISKSAKIYYDFAQREINCLQEIQSEGGHPNIVKLIETFVTQENRFRHVVMVFEALGPNLESVIFDSGKKLSVEVVKLISRQLLEAISYIHNRNLVHTDIKSANVMLAVSENDIKNLASSQDSTCSRYDIDVTKADARIVAKLADFGQALYTHERPTRHPEPNCLFRAPEQFLTTNVETASDMWSFGCMLYEMVAGSFLFACKRYKPFLKDNQIHFMYMAYHFGPINLVDFQDGLRPEYYGKFKPNGDLDNPVINETLPSFFQMAQQQGLSDKEAEEYSNFLHLFFKYNRAERITAVGALNHSFIRSNGVKRMNGEEDAPAVQPLGLEYPEVDIVEEFDRVVQFPDTEQFSRSQNQ